MSQFLARANPALGRGSPPAARSDEWLVGLHQNPGARLRLFCFPFAGGGPSVFRSWLGGMPPEVEVVRVQLPGRRPGSLAHQQPLSDMQAITDQLLPAMYPALDRPFAFFGYSMGALLAYELAARLVAQGSRGPELLAIAACRPPHAQGRDRFSQLPDDALVDLLISADPFFVDSPLVRALMTSQLALLRADLRACEEYRPSEDRVLECPMTTYGGQADPLVSGADLGDWQAYSSSSCMRHVLEGGHFFLLGEGSNRLRRLVARELEHLVAKPARSDGGRSQAGNPHQRSDRHTVWSQTIQLPNILATEDQ